MFILKRFFSRHPRRYLIFVLVVGVLLVWQLNYLNIAVRFRDQHIEHVVLKGPGDHDHVHGGRSSAASDDYIKISDVEVSQYDKHDAVQDFQNAFSLCKQKKDQCVGFVSRQSRDVTTFVLVHSLPRRLKKGVNTLYLKPEHVRRILFQHGQLQCAVPVEEVKEASSSSPRCKLPDLDPWDESIREFISLKDPMKCYGKLYTSYHGNTLKFIQPEDKDVIKHITYQSIKRSDDDVGFEYGDEKDLKLESKGVNLTDDFVQVVTYFTNGESQTDYHAVVSPKPEVLERPRKDTGIPLNIIVLGLDGNSDANFQRFLPDAFKFLRDDLKAFIFKGFSLLGEATTPQLTGLLTGKSVEANCAFHEARKGKTFDGTVDKWPFIFKTLKEHGYTTMFSEDAPNIGAFHLRLNGFKTQPCDHYGRYFWWAVPYDDVLGVHEDCINSQPQHVIQLDYLRSFIKAYPKTPKFGFTFLGSLCHKSFNMVSSGAKDVFEFLKSLKQDNHLDNTMLIVFGDHGARFDEIRSTLQGKLEERLPFLSITLPQWFREKYSDLVKNLQQNTRRIISPLDLHATFMHVLKYPENPSKSSLTSGSSLFEALPESRECKDAGIPSHFCPCILWKPVPTTHSHVQIGAYLTVAHINDLLTKDSSVTTKCHKLELDEIMSAVQGMPNKNVQLFKEIKDGTGLGIGEPIFNEESHPLECTYEIQLRVKPSMALFESTVKIIDGKFVVNGDISRVNRYGTQSECIVKSHPLLRKFCLCRH